MIFRLAWLYFFLVLGYLTSLYKPLSNIYLNITHRPILASDSLISSVFYVSAAVIAGYSILNHIRRPTLSERFSRISQFIGLTVGLLIVIILNVVSYQFAAIIFTGLRNAEIILGLGTTYLIILSPIHLIILGTLILLTFSLHHTHQRPIIYGAFSGYAIGSLIEVTIIITASVELPIYGISSLLPIGLIILTPIWVAVADLSLYLWDEAKLPADRAGRSKIRGLLKPYETAIFSAVLAALVLVSYSSFSDEPVVQSGEQFQPEENLPYLLMTISPKSFWTETPRTVFLDIEVQSRNDTIASLAADYSNRYLKVSLDKATLNLSSRVSHNVRAVVKVDQDAPLGYRFPINLTATSKEGYSSSAIFTLNIGRYGDLFKDYAEPSSIDSRLLRAARYLSSHYNETVGLIYESEDLGRRTIQETKFQYNHVYWLYSDNLLATHALLRFNETISEKVNETLHAYDQPSSRMFEVLFGEEIPQNVSIADQSLIDMTDSFVVMAELHNSSTPLRWEEYGDTLIYQSLNQYLKGNRTAAAQYFNQAYKVWDGKGINDEARESDGYYANFKLALLLYVGKVLNIDKPDYNDIENRLWSMQQGNGGITSLADFNGNPLGSANAETTSMALLPYNDELITRMRSLFGAYQPQVQKKTLILTYEPQVFSNTSSITSNITEVTIPSLFNIAIMNTLRWSQPTSDHRREPSSPI